MASWLLALLFATTAWSQVNTFVQRNSPAASVTYLSSTRSASDLTTYNFLGMNIGVAYPNRNIVIGISARSASTFLVSTVTIGGVAAQELKQHQASGSTGSFFIANVPSGTTADVVITFTGLMVRASATLWRADNLQTFNPIGWIFYSQGTTTGTLSVPAGGLVYAIAFSTGATGISWTGVTKDVDGTITDAPNTALVSAASVAVPTAQASRTVSYTMTGSASNQAGLVISLR